VFIQARFPERQKTIQPEFYSRGEDMRVFPLKGDLVTDSWNKKTKIWSGIYKLDFSPCSLGDNSVFVEFTESGDGPESILSKELKMSIIR
jgi:hypothetical protein